MTTITPANFSFKDADGDLGQVKSLTAADITLLNTALQDIEDLKLCIQQPAPTGSVMPFAGSVIPGGWKLCNGAALDSTVDENIPLFSSIGYTYGSGNGTKATCAYGTAQLAGTIGNNISVVVAASSVVSGSFDVSTYYGTSLIETQIAANVGALVDNDYIDWNSSGALTAGTYQLSGGTDGTQFLLPDGRDRYLIGAGTHILGTRLMPQLPNIIGNITNNGDQWLINTSPYAQSVATGALQISNKSTLSLGTSTGTLSSCYILDFNARRYNTQYNTALNVNALTLNYIIKG